MNGKTTKKISEIPVTMRERILAAALNLLSSGGRDAVTTRAVAEAAGVQPPVIYRHFEDKEGMLDALAEHGFARYLAQKCVRPRQLEPLDSLRVGWDEHIAFGKSRGVPSEGQRRTWLFFW